MLILLWPPSGPGLVSPPICAFGLHGKLKGICPTVLGNVQVSFPDGLQSPKIISVRACPPNEPGYQASSIAGTLASAQLMDRGLPLMRIRMTGLPTAQTAFSSISCLPGRSMLVRDLFSPQVLMPPPSTTTERSAFRALATALSISACSSEVSGKSKISDSGQFSSTSSHPFV